MSYFPARITSRTRLSTKLWLAVDNTNRITTDNPDPSKYDDDFGWLVARAQVVLDLILAQTPHLIPPDELDFWAAREVEFLSLQS